MKKLGIILCLLLFSSLVTYAQRNKNLTKTVIGDLSKVWQSFPNVKPGEFVVDFDHMVYDKSVYSSTYKYIIVLRDENDGVRLIQMNNLVMNFKGEELPIDLLRAGYNIDDYVYISKKKSLAVDNAQIKYNLHIGQETYGPYDGIECVLPKGFVYKNMGAYSYVKYNKNKSAAKHYCIVEQDNYEGEFVQCSINGKILKFVPNGNIKYYKCNDGHYYILYNDKAMNNTLLIVDGDGYELDGVVEKLDLKFSHNGNHWIAAGTDYVIVDGIYIARISENIKYVDINNKGDYFYVVDGEGFNEKAISNGNVVVDGVEIKSLTVDNEHRFNYIFKNAKGYFYAIDNDVRDYSDNIRNYFYPALNDAIQDFVVMSNDGKHKFEYHNDSPYIIIDGVSIESLMPPHYVVWKEKEHCFMWNALDNYKLMVFKYKVK